MVLVTVLAGAATALAGCGATSAPGAGGTGQKGVVAGPAAADPPAAPVPTEHGMIYATVIRHYLAGPDTSFPDRFAVAYVLDRADSAQTAVSVRAPTGPARTEPIAATDQSFIAGELRGVSAVTFVATKAEIVDTSDNCAVVRNGGIFVVVSPPEGTGSKVTVGVHGYVACLGATWLTYVVERDAGGQWRVTGTTGPHAIS